MDPSITILTTDIIPYDDLCKIILNENQFLAIKKKKLAVNALDVYQGTCCPLSRIFVDNTIIFVLFMPITELDSETSHSLNLDMTRRMIAKSALKDLLGFIGKSLISSFIGILIYIAFKFLLMKSKAFIKQRSEKKKQAQSGKFRMNRRDQSLKLIA